MSVPPEEDSTGAGSTGLSPKLPRVTRLPRTAHEPNLVPVIVLDVLLGLVVATWPKQGYHAAPLALWLVCLPLGFGILLMAFSLYTGHRAAVVIALVIHLLGLVLLGFDLAAVVLNPFFHFDKGSGEMCVAIVFLVFTGWAVARLWQWLKFDRRRTLERLRRQGLPPEEEDLGTGADWDQAPKD